MRAGYFVLAVVLVAVFGLGGCTDCACVSPSVRLVLFDGDNQELLADSISFSVDGGEVELMRESALGLHEININRGAGIFRVWVVVGENEWESGDIEVSMGGPDDCPQAETKEVTLIFSESEIDETMDEIGGSCGD